MMSRQPRRWAPSRSRASASTATASTATDATSQASVPPRAAVRSARMRAYRPGRSRRSSGPRIWAWTFLDSAITDIDGAVPWNSSVPTDEFSAEDPSMQRNHPGGDEMITDSRSRWLAFAILSLGSFMIVLDTTIVNVALPSIRTDLGFTEASLAWVVNAYMLFFGGFLLLGGRLGDLYGHRKLFVAGVVVFTAASLAAGISSSQAILIAARAAQGLGGAIVSAAGLSLMMALFTEPAERAKAMGVVGFISAGGGSVGVLLGGILTSAFGWHAVFMVNIPVGIAVSVLALRHVPATRPAIAGTRLDIAGAITVTGSLMLAVYAIVNG